MTTAEVKETLVPIEKCPSCRGKHELPINTYSKQEPWTHWYCCPETGDPVSLTVLLDDTEPLQLQGDLMRRIVDAHRTSQFFVAIFHWEKDSPPGQQCPKWWVNHHLPHAEFGGCLKYMKDAFSEIVGPSDVPAIKVAEPGLQRLNLFSDPKKNGE